MLRVLLYQATSKLAASTLSTKGEKMARSDLQKHLRKNCSFVETLFKTIWLVSESLKILAILDISLTRLLASLAPSSKVSLKTKTKRTLNFS